MDVYFTTIGGESGRASRHFRMIGDADNTRDTQNARAEKLGIVARYAVDKCDDSTLSDKDRQSIR